MKSRWETRLPQYSVTAAAAAYSQLRLYHWATDGMPSIITALCRAWVDVGDNTRAGSATIRVRNHMRQAERAPFLLMTHSAFIGFSFRLISCGIIQLTKPRYIDLDAIGMPSAPFLTGQHA